MRDAQARESLYQKYKDKPCFKMFEIYTREEHPDQNPYNADCGIANGQPSTWEQRLCMIKHYRADKKTTVPLLVDGMDDSWKDDLYRSRPTSVALIDLDQNVVYSINFALATGYYPKIDQAVADLLAKTTCPSTGTITDNRQVTSARRLTVVQSPGLLSVEVPSAGEYRIELFTPAGKCLWKTGGLVAHTISIPVSSLSAGIYLLRASSPKYGSIDRSVVIHR